MEKLNGFVTWEEECNNEIIRLNEWLKKLETYEEFAKFEEVILSRMDQEVIMLQEKIQEIEKEMNDYLLLWSEADSRTEKARYRGVLQGLEYALMILKEENL